MSDNASPLNPRNHGASLSVGDVAEQLGVSHRTVFRLIDKGHLIATNVSTGPLRRNLKITEYHLSVYLNRHST